MGTVNSTAELLSALGLFSGVGDVYVAMMKTEDSKAAKPVYDTPILACDTVSAGLTPGYAEGKQSASDRTIRKIKLLTSMDVKVEYARMLDDVKALILGRTKDANGGVAGGDSMSPLCAVGICEHRDDGTKVMRWIYKTRATEDNVTAKTQEEGTISYQIPVINFAGVPLAYETTGANGKAEHLVQYTADTANSACKWTESTFFASVVGPWSEAVSG